MNGSGVLRDPRVLAAVLVGAALRLWRLGEAPLWFDEVMTADWVARPWAELLALCLADNHPPLYFALAKLAHDGLGSAAWMLRLPSALAGVATIPLAAAAAGTLAGARRAARWGAWLAALSPFLVHHAQEARMYGLVGMLAAANLLALARFTTGKAPRLGALFGATSIGLAATHYYSVFYLGGTLLAAVAARPRPLRAWLPAGAVTAVAAATALLAAAFLARHQAGGSYALGWIALPGALWSLVAGYVFLPDTFELHGEGGHAALRYLPLALAAAPALAGCAFLALRDLDRRLWPTLLLPLASSWLAPFAIRLLLGVGVNPRYFQASVPALLTLLALGAAARGAGSRVARVAGLAVAALFAAGTTRHLAQPDHGREDVRAARAWLADYAKLHEPLLVTSREMAYLARFHWPSHEVVDYPTPGSVVDAASAARVASEIPWPGERAMYVFGRAWASDPSGALERELTQRYASCGAFEARGVRIYCLRRSSPPEPRTSSVR